MSDTTQLTPVQSSQVGSQRSQEPRARAAALTPPVDIVEDAQGVTVWADLPGVPLEKLEVKVHDGTLSIEAQAEVPVSPNVRVQYAELQQPRFARAFAISQDLDTARIMANLQDGVLKLTIPRREEARPRRIEVTGN